MATKTPAEKYILWQATPPRTVCGVSAHGGPTGDTFSIPAGMKIFFYVPPGQPFLGATQDVVDFICKGRCDNDSLDQIEVVGRSCNDYSLGKMQGYHKEDWGVFQLVRKAGSRFITADEEYAGVQFLVDTYDPSAAMGRGSGRVDMVTVRYRPASMSSCKFSQIVADLSGKGYTEVHCAFCR